MAPVFVWSVLSDLPFQPCITVHYIQASVCLEWNYWVLRNIAGRASSWILIHQELRYLNGLTMDTIRHKGPIVVIDS